MSKSVFQPWVLDLPMMQQSCVASAMRGPDGLPKEHQIKYLVRWLRRSTCHDAFGHFVYSDPYTPSDGNYTGSIPKAISLDALTATLFNNIDELPFHATHHIIVAAQIIGFHHPVGRVRAFWRNVYNKWCKKLHVTPETMEAMDKRLSDNVEQWKKTD